MDLNEFEESSRRHIMVYGPPKSGKSALTGRLAALGYQLHWCTLDGGITTLLNPEILAPEFRKNVHVIRIPDHRTNPVAITAIQEILKGGPKRFCFNHGINQCATCKKQEDAKWSHTFDINLFGDLDILVIDHLGQLTESALNKTIFKEVTGLNGDDYKPERDDYMFQGHRLAGVMSKIQAANVNIVGISHELDASNIEGKDKIVPLVGTRNFSIGAAKYWDDVVFTRKENNKYLAFSSVINSNTILTGTRSGVDLSKDAIPDLSKLFVRHKGPKEVTK